MKNTIRVTGSHGYIGSLLCNYLKLDGSSRYDIKRHEEYDIEETPVIRKLVHGCDTIVHLAAISGIKQCEDYSDAAWLLNRNATLRIAKALKEAGGRKFIFASSSSVYGEATEYHVDEACTTNPRNVYGRTKLGAEKDILELQDDTFKVFILRKSNVYGKGTYSKGITVMDKFISSYLDGETITVAGTGSQKRDFLHIMDTVSLYARIAIGDKYRSGIYNVGGNEIVSIRELAYLINDIGESIFGHRVPVEFNGRNDSSSGWHDFTYDCRRSAMEFQFSPIFRIEDYIKERMLEEVREINYGIPSK